MLERDETKVWAVLRDRLYAGSKTTSQTTQSKPRLVGISGQKLKSGKWNVEDGLILRLEQ